MKKFISIFLSAMMIMSMLSVCVFGAWNNEAQANWTDPIVINSAEAHEVTAAVVTSSTMIVEAGQTLTIKAGGSLTFSGSLAGYNLTNNGKIVIYGALNFVNGATFINNGTIEFASANGTYGKSYIADTSAGYNNGVIKNSNFDAIGTLYHNVTICKSFSVTYNANDMYNKTQTTVPFTVSYILASKLSSDIAYTDEEYDDGFPNVCSTSADANVYVPEGKVVYVKITVPEDKGDFIDVGKLSLSGGTSLIENSRGVFRVEVSSAMNLSVSSVAYKDIVKTFKIELPHTDGYRVVTFDGVGESVETSSSSSSSSGLSGLTDLFGIEEETEETVYVTVEYGKMLSFRVELKDGYKNSEDNVKVYIDANEIEADEYGYYDITGPFVTDESTGVTSMATAGGVQSNFTIRVMGVASDELNATMNNVVSYIQQIFSIIKSIFQFFASIFTGDIDTGDLGELF